MTGPNFVIFTREFINISLLPRRTPALKPMLSFSAEVIRNNLHTRIRMHPLVAFRRIGSFGSYRTPFYTNVFKRTVPLCKELQGTHVNRRWTLETILTSIRTTFLSSITDPLLEWIYSYHTFKDNIDEVFF